MEETGFCSLQKAAAHGWGRSARERTEVTENVDFVHIEIGNQYLRFNGYYVSLIVTAKKQQKTAV